MHRPIPAHDIVEKHVRTNDPLSEGNPPSRCGRFAAHEVASLTTAVIRLRVCAVCGVCVGGGVLFYTIVEKLSEFRFEFVQS